MFGNKSRVSGGESNVIVNKTLWADVAETEDSHRGMASSIDAVRSIVTEQLAKRIKAIDKQFIDTPRRLATSDFQQRKFSVRRALVTLEKVSNVE